MNEIGRTGEVQEVTVTSEEYVGMTVREFGELLPSGVLIALVGRDGESEVPEASFTIQENDRLTFLGDHDAVRKAIEMCHPDEA